MSKGRYSPYLPRRNTENNGYKAQKKGADVEWRFYRALRLCLLSDNKPIWFIGLLKTEKNSINDWEGRDFIALTRFCDFGIQIKSSEVGVEKFKEKNKGFFGIILIIKLYYTYEQILTLFFEEAEEFLKNINKQNSE